MNALEQHLKPDQLLRLRCLELALNNRHAFSDGERRSFTEWADLFQQFVMTGVPFTDNPWITGNVTRQHEIMQKNPELARKLIAEVSEARGENSAPATQE
jgi:uncharacterized Rossmann fold enzyme